MKTHIVYMEECYHNNIAHYERKTVLEGTLSEAEKCLSKILNEQMSSPAVLSMMGPILIASSERVTTTYSIMPIELSGNLDYC